MAILNRWSAAWALAGFLAMAGPRGTAQADQSLELPGNVHPLARAEFDEGAAAAETRLERMVLVLKAAPDRQVALDALVEAQQDPRSASFHHWLRPDEFAARYGAAASEVARVSDWLQRQGFAIDEVPAGNRLIVFSGNAGQVVDAFHTELHRYRVRGVEHLANAQEPEIPKALAGVVEGIVSLHDFRRASTMRPRRMPAAKPQWNLYGEHYLFPADLAAIYDVNPLYAAATAGSGVAIAIAGRSNINLSDVAAFRTEAQLAANPPTVVLDGTDPGLVEGDQDEATLDVEWAGALAPAAAVMLVPAASTAVTDGVDLSAEYIVNHALAPVLSVSYASCEEQMTAGELAFYNGLWEQAASEGMSVLVASGDAGAAGCDQASEVKGTAAAVNGLCSSPYSTCVGGTELNDKANPGQYWAATNGPAEGSAIGYIPEQVWNESGADGGTGLWSTGGGVSAVYAQPAWQQGVSGADAGNGMRAVPDVSLTAAGHDGYVMDENGVEWIVSGTSAAAPSLAGMLALVVEKMGNTGQGNANPGLYALAERVDTPFHATPSGANTVPGVAGYSASGAAYNRATGLGSVDAARLADAWSTVAAPATLTLAGVAGPVRLAPGGSAAMQLQVTTTGPFSGAITLTLTGLPAGVTAAWSGNPMQAGGGVTTLTLTAAPLTSLSASQITVTAQGNGMTATQSFAVAVISSRVHLGRARLPDPRVH